MVSGQCRYGEVSQLDMRSDIMKIRLIILSLVLVLMCVGIVSATAPDVPILKYPSNNSQLQNTDIILICEVNDNDGDPLNITFYNASNGSMIAWNTVYDGNGKAACIWRGLEHNTSYLWYANATDGVTTTQSNNFTFHLIPANKSETLEGVYIEPIIGLGWGNIENTTNILEMIVMPYTNAMGSWFYVVIMFTGVGLMYVKTQRAFIPSSILLLNGIVMATMLPDEVYGAAMAMMALGFTGVVYATFHRRM